LPYGKISVKREREKGKGKGKGKGKEYKAPLLDVDVTIGLCDYYKKKLPITGEFFCIMISLLY
jgi:hypothetical protein